MKDKVFRFRSVKWGDPDQKLKVIADDIGQSRLRLWFVRYWEYGVVVIAFAATVACGSVLF